MATFAVFVVAAVCTVVNPAAAILLTMVFSSAPFALISGAVLFYQCRKRQEQARALIAMVAEQAKHETAMAVTASIESATARDKTKAQLSMQIENAPVVTPHHTLVSLLFRKLANTGSA